MEKKDNLVEEIDCVNRSNQLNGENVKVVILTHHLILAA